MIGIINLSARCMLSYWQSLGTENQIKCPLDRTFVSYLAPNFAVRDQCARLPNETQPTAAEQQQLDSELAAYNARFANIPRGLGQEIREDLAIYRNLPANSIHKWIINFMVIGTVLYLLFPVDLIPDSLGLVGYLDDAFAIIFILIIVVLMLGAIRSNIIQNGNRN